MEKIRSSRDRNNLRNEVKEVPQTIEERKKKKKVAIKSGNFWNETNKNLEKDLFKEFSEVQNKKYLCMIINYTFKGQGILERKNSPKDIDTIYRVISKLENFKIETLYDLSKTALMNKINELTSTVTDDHQIILIITMTHGSCGRIQIKDELLSVDEYMALFGRLFEKDWLTKVFILSYCQGDKVMRNDFSISGGQTKHKEYKNALIGYSQQPGYKSFSGIEGSVYVQEWLRILDGLLKQGEKIDGVRIQTECELTFESKEFIFEGDQEPMKQHPWHYKSVDSIVLYDPDRRHKARNDSISLVDNDIIFFDDDH